MIQVLNPRENLQHSLPMNPLVNPLGTPRNSLRVNQQENLQVLPQLNRSAGNHQDNPVENPPISLLANHHRSPLDIPLVSLHASLQVNPRVSRL